MIDFETLPIGTFFYCVQKVNNSFHRTRLEFVDSEGHTWHRYNLPTWSVEVRRHQLVARIRKIVEGNWSECEEDKETEYLVEYSNGKTDYFYIDNSNDQYFLDHEDAQAAAEILRKTLEK